MQRRTFLTGLSSASLAVAETHQPHGSNPDIILLLADDQRADTIAALGNPNIRTPNLDALARRSVVFRNAYCMGGNVAAVCTPSRNMLLSGRAYTRFDLLASGDDPNFPVAMKRAGYTTYHHGKRGNSAPKIQARFDICKYLNENDARNSGAPGRIIADEALEFLGSRPQTEPLFLYLAFEAPHDPRVPTKQDLDYYGSRDLPLPPNFLPVHPFDNGEMTVRDELLARWPRTRNEVVDHLREYYAVITGLDAQIGRVLNAVEKRGREAIIIFSSDQGLALGSHGLMGKQSLYDHSMKSPLLISAPGLKPAVTNGLTYLFDIFPTVLDMIGAPAEPGLDGRSFLQTLKSPSRPARQELLLGYRACQRAIRDERYKLIVYPQINRYQLFDLRIDAHETRDLAAVPAHKARVARMMARLRQLQSNFGDPLPLESAQPRPAEWRPPTGEALNEIRRRWRMPPVSE